MSKTTSSLLNNMDGITRAYQISSLFAEKYDALYNSVSYNNEELGRLKTDIESLIDTGCTKHIHNITIQNVKEAISKLKLGKKEENGLFSNHFIYGSDRLIVVIAILFSSMLIHGIAPENL